MSIDVFCALFLLFCALAGLFTGAFVQVAKLVSAVAAYFGARFLAPWLASFLSETIELHGDLAEPLTLFVVWLFLYVLLSSLGKAALGGLAEKSAVLDTVDRSLGLLVGVLKGAILLVILLLLLSAMKERLLAREEVEKACAESELMNFLSGTRLRGFLLPEDDRILIGVLEKEADRRRLHPETPRDPVLSELETHKTARDLFFDPATERRLEERRFFELRASPRFRQTLGIFRNLLRKGELKGGGQDKRKDVEKGKEKEKGNRTNRVIGSVPKAGGG